MAKQLPHGATVKPSEDVPAQVSFITWGNHQAVNAYADFPNVILAGTLFMRPSYYTGLTYLAQGKPVDRHQMPEDAVTRTIVGEHRHLLLQAICRGRVRKLDGDQCLPMDAYVIAAAKSGIPGALVDVFPRCQLRRWEPLDRQLSGKVREAVDYVRGALSNGVEWIALKAIQKALGVDRRNFGKLVSQRADWLDAIAALGLETTKGERGARGLRLIAEEAIPA